MYIKIYFILRCCKGLEVVRTQSPVSGTTGIVVASFIGHITVLLT